MTRTRLAVLLLALLAAGPAAAATDPVLRTLRWQEGAQLAVTVSYPVLAGPEAQSFFRDFDRQQRLWFDATIAELRSEQQAAIGAPFPFRYITQADYRLVHQSAKLLSLYGTIYHFAGGAHGATEFVNENYRLTARGATPFALADLFIPDSAWVGRLSPLCLDGLLAQQASLVMDSTVTSFTAEDMSSCTISPAGLSIHFPHYAVGCYAEGTFAVVIPWPKIADLLRRDGPAAEFLP